MADDAYGGNWMDVTDDAYGGNWMDVTNDAYGGITNIDPYGTRISGPLGASDSSLANRQLGLGVYTGSTPGSVVIDGTTYGIGGADLLSKLRGLLSSPAGAASGIAALYGLMGGNTPKTAGFQGEIPKYDFSQSRIPQPVYQPYTGEAVMGRQFLTAPKYVAPLAEGETRPATVEPTGPGQRFTQQQITEALRAELEARPDTSFASILRQARTIPGITDEQVREAYRALGQTPPPVTTETYMPPRLTPYMSSAQIAEAYKQYFDVAGGDTPENQQAAIRFLRNSGLTDRQITTAYDQYKREYESGEPVTMQQISEIQPQAEQTSEETKTAAQGGIMMAKGRYLRGASDGMADEIRTSIEDKQPARLSHGEFVIPADVVSHLGNGNSDAGAKVLYKMMDRVRQARTGNKRQGKKINPEKFTPGGIASYASGGEVRFQTGGTTNTGVTSMSPYGTSTQTTLSEWAGPYVAGMLGQARALAQTPYQAYLGPLTAGYSPLQQQYFTGLGSLGFPSTLGQSFTDRGVMQSYMNPYMQQILQPQLQAMQRQADIQKSALGAQAARAGAFGGARAGLMNQQLNAELMRQQQQATGQAYQNAFTQGLGQFNIEQQRAAERAGMLAAAGQMQRGIEQEGIGALRAQFEEERKFPYAQLQFQQSMLQGLPIGTSTVLPNITPMQQIGQAGEQATKIYDLLKGLGLGPSSSTPTGTGSTGTNTIPG